MTIININKEGCGERWRKLGGKKKTIISGLYLAGIYGQRDILLVGVSE